MISVNFGSKYFELKFCSVFSLRLFCGVVARQRCAGDGGRPVACHACLTLMTPVAYRPIIRFSRTVSCKSCASDRSQPCYRFWRSTIRRGEGALPGSAQIHVASIEHMHFLDSGGGLKVRGTSVSRGKGSCGARVQVFGRECAVQRDRIDCRPDFLRNRVCYITEREFY